MAKNESILGNWELDCVFEPQQLFNFASSYLQGSIDLCQNMINNQNLKTWPNANVIMFLSAHSVELFFKGALLIKTSSFLNTHKISDLEEKYYKLYEDEKYKFDCLFRSLYLNFDAKEIEVLEKKKIAPSIFHRYPFDKPEKAWSRIHGFFPKSHLQDLQTLKKDYRRLIKEFEKHGINEKFIDPE